MKSANSFILAIIGSFVGRGLGYVPQEMKEQWRQEGYNLEKSVKIIEECAEKGEPRKDLYSATRFIDRHAHKLYSDPKDQQELWERAKGSWELRLAYDDSHNEEFFPYPDFRDFAMAYIMVDEDYFGKGVAKSAAFSFVAMGGPSRVNTRKRQVLMNYEDFYISGNCVPDWDLSYFMRGYARNWYAKERKRPPLAFTMIAASDTCLVVRGSKTGGMAIFRRLKEAMQPCSYGDSRPQTALS
jgi:hypothetical protein